MTYKQTLDFLFSKLPVYHRIGAAAYKADLNNTIALCNLLGNPQNQFTTIHIAGTNGKGSVSHMLASILQEKGLKTGLYTSPHLKDFRERIRVNGKMIPKGRVTGFVRKYRSDIDRIQPSFFEMTVAMAFDHFHREGIDIAVIETGLGGRLDSTNIINPLLSVITNISYDHMQFLGNTLERIAIEKAGIIKPEIPVVVGETQEEVRQVFLNKSKESGSEILFADTLFHTVRSSGIPANPLSLIADVYRNDKAFISQLTSPLPGNYQLKNITTVMGVCESLNKQGINLEPGQIRKGIERVIINTRLGGRWQVLLRSPLTICDTGHNEAGLKEVLAQISMTPHRKLHFVFGVVNDKEILTILKMLPQHATYYFCKAEIPRALDANELKAAAEKAGLSGNTYPSVKAALDAAQQNAGKDDLVFVGGSTFVVAEVV
jgi:dihydrofolate synthase / folylpolyglutamate synthase